MAKEKRVVIIGNMHKGRFLSLPDEIKREILSGVDVVDFEDVGPSRIKNIAQQILDAVSRKKIPKKRIEELRKKLSKFPMLREYLTFIEGTGKEVRLEKYEKNKDSFMRHENKNLLKKLKILKRSVKERTKKDVGAILEDLKNGKTPVLVRGLAHIPQLEKKLRKMGIKVDVYISGGIPAVLRGTPTMQPIWYSLIGKGRIKKMHKDLVLGESLLFHHLKKEKKVREYMLQNPTAFNHLVSSFTKLAWQEALRWFTDKKTFRRRAPYIRKKDLKGKKYKLFKTLFLLNLKKNKEILKQLIEKNEIIRIH